MLDDAVDASEIWLYVQLMLVVYLIIYRVSYIPGGDRRISEASTVGPSPKWDALKKNSNIPPGEKENPLQEYSGKRICEFQEG